MQQKKIGLRKEQGGFVEFRIWIDSLCIPIQQKYQYLREKAVQGMKPIYERAKGVLVIDSELVTVHPGIDDREVGARFYLSGWMSRLWTLQEGAFNRNLFVALGFDISRDVRKFIDHGAGISLFVNAATAVSFTYTGKTSITKCCDSIPPSIYKSSWRRDDCHCKFLRFGSTATVQHHGFGRPIPSQAYEASDPDDESNS